MTKKFKGVHPNFVINDEISGTDVARVNQAIDVTEGKVKNAVQRLMMSWPAEDIVKVQYATRKGVRCKCPIQPEITVHPGVAYALARKSPSSTASGFAVTELAAQYGGSIPLRFLGKVLGPWDSLIEELTPRMRG